MALQEEGMTKQFWGSSSRSLTRMTKIHTAWSIKLYLSRTVL